MKTVLMLEDDEDLRSETVEALEDARFRVAEAATVKEFWGRYREVQPDVVILDMSLPDGRGMEVARDLRRESDVAILFLSGMNDEIDRIVGLELGADDFVRKPCSPRELTARINSVLRRSRPARELQSMPVEAVSPAAQEEPVTVGEIVRFEGFRINLPAMELYDSLDQQIVLTTAEFDLLKVLVERPRRVLTRDILLDLLRGENWAGYDRTIDGLVSRLRKKLSTDNEPCGFLKTVRGAGYMFTAHTETT